MQAAARIRSLLRTWARKLGPYVVLEILLPGGTLLALLLFVYRRSPRPQLARYMQSERRPAGKRSRARIAGDVEMATPCSTSV
jgi:hypothetical protein